MGVDFYKFIVHFCDVQQCPIQDVEILADRCVNNAQDYLHQRHPRSNLSAYNSAESAGTLTEMIIVLEL